ncbi:MAG: transposase family protein [Mesotoga sp.]|uniref:transposase family protein n=1 Tax=Mesotoga sp. TaxID=2053577 RepID=UPI002A32FA3B|nr:transposase family protein [Synergistales bacterium]MDD3133082.1 transposase family protein [Synergistales bacterium]MDI9392170.1 transposase family protein [Synergistota bacterium]
MRLSMVSRREVIVKSADKYRKASKKDKGQILDRITEITGYNRDYASHLLTLFGKRLYMESKRGTRFILEADRKDSKVRRKRKRTYDREVADAVATLWKMMDYICGKRLAAAIPWLVPKLEATKDLFLDDDRRLKVMSVSAATIDRMLADRKRKLRLKERSSTKPGTLLKHKIPIRTFADWDEDKPGFVEIDLVSHEGGCSSGEFAFTLDVTDVASGWTELMAVRNRARIWTMEALKAIRSRLPFPLCGIDSDNDSTFINHHLQKYCEDERITFTRSRAGNKNDNCYVEQKNWSVARRVAGYARYDTEGEVKALNELYDVYRLYVNFFLPSAKLISKTRTGAKVKKSYDTPKTPCQRLLDSDHVAEEVKSNLRGQFDSLNPADLKKEIDRLKSRLNRAFRNKNRTLAGNEIDSGKVA